MKNEQVKKMMDEAVNGEYIWEGIGPECSQIRIP